MASSLETNKILAAILTAGIFASGAGVVSRMIYHPHTPEEPAYVIEVAAGGEEGGGGEGGGEEVSLAALLAGADTAKGESGAKKCSACHTFEEGGANKIGPNLHGVVGRAVGSVAGFSYSDAMAGHGGNWDYDSLNAFLTNPKGFVPGTKMAFAGIKGDQDRADVIMYLHSQSPDAPPLPAAETENAAGEAEGGQSETQAADASATEAGAGEAAAAAADAAVEQGEAVAEQAGEAAGQVAETASDMVEGAAATASDAAEAATDAVSEAADAAGEAVAGAGDAAEDVAKAAVEQAANATQAVSDAAGGAADAVAGAAGATVAAVSDAASGAADQASETVDAAAGGLVAMIAEGDVAKGEKVSKKCKACHVFEEDGKNKLGPALWGVIGRPIASHEGFTYSSALQGIGGEWTYDKLNEFLTAPKTYAPGTKMVFAGVKKDEDRADLLAYLRTLAAEPAPLN
ncbi:MAG: cytochrome c family protein [Alphaproteobacteria bacterium]